MAFISATSTWPRRLGSFSVVLPSPWRYDEMGRFQNLWVTTGGTVMLYKCQFAARSKQVTSQQDWINGPKLFSSRDISTLQYVTKLVRNRSVEIRLKQRYLDLFLATHNKAFSTSTSLISEAKSPALQIHTCRISVPVEKAILRCPSGEIMHPAQTFPSLD
jgi:hypothetical protein